MLWKSLILAISSRNTKMVAELIRKGVLAENNDKEYFPLHLAAHKGSGEIVSLLLDRQPNLINVKDIDGNTALHIAAQEGRELIVSLLLDRQPDLINVKDIEGNTALHIAAQEDRDGITELLLNEQPDLINTINYKGELALHIAALNDSKKVIEILMAKDESTVSIQDNDGFTPIDKALEYGHTEATELLRQVSGSSADHVVIHEDELESQIEDFEKNEAESDEDDITLLMEEFLAKTKLTTTGNLIEAVKANDFERVKELVRQEADINAKSISGNSVLHIAVRNGSLDIINFLLQQEQIDVATTDGRGNTVLHKALAPIEQINVLEALLNNQKVKSIIDTQNSFGQTALCYASSDIALNTLLEANADVKIGIDQNCNPLDVCAFKGNISGVQILLAKGATITQSTFVSASDGIIHDQENISGCMGVLKHLHTAYSSNAHYSSVLEHLQSLFGQEEGYDMITAQVNHQEVVISGTDT